MKTSLCLLAAGSIVTGVYFSQVTPKEPSYSHATWVTFSKPPPCDVRDLSFSKEMKSQIRELCSSGFSREEAIQGLQIMYRTPNLDPSSAVELVKLAKLISLRSQNPDPWK